MSATTIHCHGKLLITAEYLVLRGAEALAAPTRLGQHFSFRKSRGADLQWRSLRPDGSVWFSGVFSLLDFSAQEATDPDFAAGITKVLNGIARKNPDFLADWKGQTVESKLDFEPEWGLGTSSTLIAAMAEWGETEPYGLLERTFGGSGYDVACATADGPILYQSTDDEIRITPVELEWPFRDQLRLVWSGRKESSGDSIKKHADAVAKVSAAEVEAFSKLSDGIADAADLATFRGLLQEHNERLSRILGMDPNPWAPDFPGTIKPLGAWGGDFFLAASDEDPKAVAKWFKDKGFGTQFAWKELILED